ncbi:MAG: hypothetical protein ABI779_22505 [Acidobacteriota bacterium]
MDPLSIAGLVVTVFGVVTGFYFWLRPRVPKDASPEARVGAAPGRTTTSRRRVRVFLSSTYEETLIPQIDRQTLSLRIPKRLLLKLDVLSLHADDLEIASIGLAANDSARFVPWPPPYKSVSHPETIKTGRVFSCVFNVHALQRSLSESGFSGIISLSANVRDMNGDEYVSNKIDLDLALVDTDERLI